MVYRGPVGVIDNGEFGRGRFRIVHHVGGAGLLAWRTSNPIDWGRVAVAVSGLTGGDQQTDPYWLSMYSPVAVRTTVQVTGLVFRTEAPLRETNRIGRYRGFSGRIVMEKII